jgi:hypothetical protein
MFRVGRVLPLTLHTPIPLRTRICFTGFVLACGCLTFWTFLHGSILAHLFGHPLNKVELRTIEVCENQTTDAALA